MTRRIALCLIASILVITLKREITFINVSLLLVLLVYSFIKDKKCLPFLFLVGCFFFFVANFETPDVGKVSGSYTVVETKNNYFIFKNDRGKYVCYDDYDFCLYAKIDIEGEYKSLETNKSSSRTTFNDYLTSQGIYQEMKIHKYEIINNGDTFKEQISSYLTDNLSEDSANMIGLLLLGKKSGLEDFYDTLIDLSAVQLFVISGFHLNILTSIFDLIFKKKEKVLLITPFFLLPYLYLLNFSIPVMRAFFFLLIVRYSKHFNMAITRVDAIFFLAIAFLFFDYHLIYNLSYQLTFLVTVVLELLNTIDNKNFFFRYIIRPIIIQISVMPILMNINYQIAPLSFLTNILLSFPITILYLFSWLTAIFKFLDFIYGPFVNGMMVIIDSLSNISPIIITGTSYFPFVFLLYSGLIIYIFASNIKNKKLKYIGLSFLFVGTFLNVYNHFIIAKDSVTFLDVGQGDATLITANHNQTTILIDTGGSIYYDVAKTKLIPYFKSQGIGEIDLIIITHLDYDHYGALESLTASFQVREVTYGYEEAYIKSGDIEIYNLNRYYDANSTDNESSAVLYFKHCGYDFLVMGDAPKEIEEKIVIDYPNLYVDVLRIAHHGSKTSSSLSFLETIDPKVAIISVGKNNYGHPSKEVLDNLSKMDVIYFRTDRDGNIIITRNGLRLRV